MKKTYIMAFSSFYKAVYARDVLAEAQIRTAVQRTPPQMMKTCGYGLKIRTDDISRVMGILKDRDIEVKGLYLAESGRMSRISGQKISE